jgi:hypothetical protein
MLRIILEIVTPIVLVVTVLVLGINVLQNRQAHSTWSAPRGMIILPDGTVIADPNKGSGQ